MTLLCPIPSDDVQELAKENYHEALQSFEKLEEDTSVLKAKAIIFAKMYILQGDWEKAKGTLENFL